MIALFIGLVVGLAGGVIGTLVFQGGEVTGRLAQHARDLSEAWFEADEALARSVRLEVQLREAQDEFETRYANLARALDVEVRKNHTIESRRVQAWKALDSAVHELQASKSCVRCSRTDHLMDDHCFACGLLDIETSLNQSESIAQA